LSSVGSITSESLLGRQRETAELDALLIRARAGQSGTIVVYGEAGVGKTALLDHAVAHGGANLQVHRIAASESEMELAYAGLQMLCSPMLGILDRLPAPQRDALATAFGLRMSSAPDPFLVGLAVLGLLTELADEKPLLCVVDDAHWLDDASAQALAFVTRRIEAERIAIVLAVRVVTKPFAELPGLHVRGLPDEHARELFHRAFPGTIDQRVRDQILAEARGNPLALRELPHLLGPAAIAGGFAVTGGMPLQTRIEKSLVARLQPLPDAARLFLLLAAADPTGDPELLWRASASLGLGPENVDIAERADALTIGARVAFRHPLVRSAAYGMAAADDRRRVHAALADATDAQRDPDRRAWHRANATLLPDVQVADDLERSAARARTRGGAAAAAAFLERAAALTPTPFERARRLLAAAAAKHDAGAPAATLQLIDSSHGLPLTEFQQAQVARLRARARYALRRDAGAARQLLAAAQGLEALDPVLALDTYIEALAAAVYGGRLGDAGEAAVVARSILQATGHGTSERARDLLLRGQALLVVEGQKAAIPTLQRALRAFLEQPTDPLELHWMWFASRAAQDLWDSDALRALATRQVEHARAEGSLTVLPIALSLQMLAQTVDGNLDAAEASCDEIDAIKQATGHPLPQYGRMFLAAYRGQVDVAVRMAAQLRTDGESRGEGYAVSAANFAEAIAFNGVGRFEESAAAAKRELPYTHELNHAMRTLLELVEAATRTGDRELAEQALARLESVTIPIGNDWALGVAAMARAQLSDDADADTLFEEALERFDRVRIPIMIGRTRLLYGEALRRRNRRVDAREQLRSAHELLLGVGLRGFAERAARELGATGEIVRSRTVPTREQLTNQELNVARLAREGLTNRDIGARLFISARTAEYHLHKVFVKLGITSRAELRDALVGLD